MQVKALKLQEFISGFDSFLPIDIRSETAYLARHIQNSINLQTLDSVLEFLAHNDIPKPLCFVCFSSTKAKDMAHQLNKAQSSYPHEYIYYLESGIMELDGLVQMQEGGKPFDGEGSDTKSNDKTSSNAQAATTSHDLIAATKNELKEKFLNTKRAWVIAFSGGKDSTCILQLFYEMLLSLPKEQQRQSYAIASNTLVEAPHIEKFLQNVITSINTHARENNIPFEVLQVCPSLKDDFFVNLIGKGYPSPTRTFRWCTDRLKITPTKDEVAKITKKHGSCLLVLGTREAESSSRKKSIQKRVLNNQGFSQHEDYPNTMTYAPIAKWDTDLVWAYLSTHKPKWSMDHSELFRLYAKASGDECQFITHLAQSSCGGSRFGCWVCTVVNEDKSLQGFIETGEEHLKPLNEFRNYIKELRENENARSDYKRDGRAVYKLGGRGAFLSHIRIEILKNLLECERQYHKLGGIGELISVGQIEAIQEVWDSDFDFHKSALALAIQFDKGVSMGEKKNQILHEELLDNICATNECETISASDTKALLERVIEIHNTHGARGRDSAPRFIRDEIKKMLDDKSSKEA